MMAIAEVNSLTRKEFLEEVLPAGKPLIIRGLVKEWPIVQAAQSGDQTFCDYLRSYDRGYALNTAFGPPSINGRLFYNADLSGMNFRLEESRLLSSLDYLLAHKNDNPAPLLAIQSIPVRQYLPGIERANVMPLLPSQVEPRIWLGGKSTVAAHFDPSENIACCVAGHRKFTLFPPDQIGNLYVGPFENTPSGAVISMVDFDAPDFERYPRFRGAQEAALVAELLPGDAIYIPYLWWHHVQSLAGINALVNYWWSTDDESMGDPINALLHSIMSVKSLNSTHRAAWKAMFEHYVFNEGGVEFDHLPEERRGVLGSIKPESLRRLRERLSMALSRRR